MFNLGMKGARRMRLSVNTLDKVSVGVRAAVIRGTYYMEIMGAVGQKQYSSRRMNQSKVGDACHPLA